MTNSPSSIILSIAVGTTAFDRLPLPTIVLNAKLDAPANRATYSPFAATSYSLTPGATFAAIELYDCQAIAKAS